MSSLLHSAAMRHHCTPFFMPTVRSLVRLYYHLVILFLVKCDQMITVNNFLNVLAIDGLSFISNIISVKIFSNFNFHTDDSKYTGIYFLTFYLLTIFPPHNFKQTFLWFHTLEFDITSNYNPSVFSTFYNPRLLPNELQHLKAFQLTGIYNLFIFATTVSHVANSFLNQLTLLVSHYNYQLYAATIPLSLSGFPILM